MDSARATVDGTQHRALSPAGRTDRRRTVSRGAARSEVDEESAGSRGSGGVTESAEGSRARFCSECGTEFLADARFCHSCGKPVEGSSPPRATTMSPALKWAVPGVALLAVLAV